jgi:CheY-like chemotaxis protein
MGTPTIKRTVAIFNASDDTVEMLQTMLAARGHVGVSGRADDVKSGELDFIDFMETHKPDALIWDIAPPYDRNWHFFKLLRSTAPLAGCGIVLTTTNKKNLDALVGHETGAIEVVGKPYDIELIVDTVVRAIDDQRSEGRRLAVGPR